MDKYVKECFYSCRPEYKLLLLKTQGELLYEDIVFGVTTCLYCFQNCFFEVIQCEAASYFPKIKLLTSKELEENYFPYITLNL